MIPKHSETSPFMLSQVIDCVDLLQNTLTTHLKHFCLKKYYIVGKKLLESMV